MAASLTRIKPVRGFMLRAEAFASHENYGTAEVVMRLAVDYEDLRPIMQGGLRTVWIVFDVEDLNREEKAPSEERKLDL